MTISIVDAMESKTLFGPWFKPSLLHGDSWKTWKCFLKGLFALPMDANELETFQRFTGRTCAPQTQFGECFIVAGRRAGKSRISATIGVYLAAFRDYSAVLSPGEQALVMLLAADKRQARVLRNYIDAFFSEIPILAALVENRTQESITLKNGVAVEVHTSSYRSVRGYTLAAVICDEISFWPADADSANPAQEVLSAVRPGLSTIPGSLLLAISSPYSKRGPLYEAFRDHYGKDGSSVLVWRAGSREMNSTMSVATVAGAYLRDSVSARTEYDAEFRSDLESLFTTEVIEQRIVAGRCELPPSGGVSYVGFCDPSGGVGDSMTLAIAHEDEGMAILDCVREVTAPFQPSLAVAEFVQILRRYHVSEVEGDKYGASWVSESFSRLGVTYRPSELSRSQIYLEFLPIAMSGQCQLLDNRRMANQFTNLERRTGRGADIVDHPPNQHDDLCNAAAGALVRALAGVGQYGFLTYAMNPQPPIPEIEKQFSTAAIKAFELQMAQKLFGPSGGGSAETEPCPRCGNRNTTIIGGVGKRCGQCAFTWDAPEVERPPNRGDIGSDRWSVKQKTPPGFVGGFFKGGRR